MERGEGGKISTGMQLLVSVYQIPIVPSSSYYSGKEPISEWKRRGELRPPVLRIESILSQAHVLGTPCHVPASLETKIISLSYRAQKKNT